jgi:O-methyltransferase involved in polyketide biosynthesis
MNDGPILSVSDTAKHLVMLKSVTSIPFAKQTAKLLTQHEITERSIDPARIDAFYQSCVGFEARYLSIDHILAATDARNFLELSSGYSFRSLVFGSAPGVLYIDTDLPEIIDNKKVLATRLKNPDEQLQNEPVFLALNALDRESFLQTATMFPKGPIGIINEGLLIYLDDDEKRRLCQTIHSVLTERGGFWVTGDIYIRGAQNRERANLFSPQAREFLAKHRVLENMFSDFETADQFFKECGFTIDKHTADEIYDQLTSLEYIKRSPTIDESVVRAGLEARQTWVLRPA